MPSIRLLFMNTNNINLAINQQLSESNRAYNLSKQINAVNNGLSLKSRVIYCGTVICLIRNRPHNEEWDGIEVASLGNGCPFHFCTVSSKGICQPLLFSLIRNELVSSHHSSYEGMDVRIDFGTTFLRKMYKTFICLKSQGLHPGYLSRFIACLLYTSPSPRD